MAGLGVLLAGALTFFAVLLRPKNGGTFWIRVLSLAPLLLLYGALSSAGKMAVYHFSLEGLRFDLSGDLRTLTYLGGKPPEEKQDAPFVAFNDFISSGASAARLEYDPKEGLSLLCEEGDVVAGIGGLSPENLASNPNSFCHVAQLQDGDELRLSAAGGNFSIPIRLSEDGPTLAGCAAPDSGGLRSLRAFALLDALNQITTQGCRDKVQERPDADEKNWRYQPTTTSEGQRLLLPFKSYLLWSKQSPTNAYLSLLDPNLSLWRNGSQVKAPEKVLIRKVEAESGGEAVALASSLAANAARVVLVRRIHALRYEAIPGGCGQGASSGLCSFFRVDLSERAISLKGESNIDEASMLRADLEEPAVVPVRDEALLVDDVRRPVLFVSGWGGSLTREEAQTTLLFPYQVGGFGPLRVRFDVTETGVEVTAPNSTGQYEGAALVAVGARSGQILLGVSRYETPWFLMWLFAALLVGRAILLPNDMWLPRAPRAAIMVASFLLSLRALFGLKAYVLFPVDRESFELGLLGATLVPAVLVSAIAFAREVSARDEMSGPWGIAIGHALLSIGAASAYYSALAPVSKIIFFLLAGSALFIAALAPFYTLLLQKYQQRVKQNKAQTPEPNAEPANAPVSNPPAISPAAPAPQSRFAFVHHILFWPLLVGVSLFLVRIMLALVGLREAIVLGGNRVPFSIIHVPIAYLAIAWISSIEARWPTKLRPITFAMIGALFVVIPGLTNDWGMMLLGLPPALLVLGSRRVIAARLLLLALALVVGVPKIFGGVLAPGILSLSGEKQFDLPNGAYRLLLTLDTDTIDAVGSVSADKVAEHAAIITRYAQGQGTGDDAIWGDGYLANDIKAYGPAVVQTLMTDGVTATYLAPEFGIAGTAGTLLALAALLIVGLAPSTKPEEETTFSALRAMMATYTAFAGFYMIAAPVSLVFFTGKNFPLLSIISKSDLLEGGLFLFLAGMYLSKESESSPAPKTQKQS
jgi:hypothetical protein